MKVVKKLYELGLVITEEFLPIDDDNDSEFEADAPLLVPTNECLKQPSKDRTTSNVDRQIGPIISKEIEYLERPETTSDEDSNDYVNNEWSMALDSDESEEDDEEDDINENDIDVDLDDESNSSSVEICVKKGKQKGSKCGMKKQFVFVSKKSKR